MNGHEFTERGRCECLMIAGREVSEEIAREVKQIDLASSGQCHALVHPGNVHTEKAETCFWTAKYASDLTESWPKRS